MARQFNLSTIKCTNKFTDANRCPTKDNEAREKEETTKSL